MKGIIFGSLTISVAVFAILLAKARKSKKAQEAFEKEMQKMAESQHQEEQELIQMLKEAKEQADRLEKEINNRRKELEVLKSMMNNGVDIRIEGI